ncbi:RCC1-like G exchanging factor-like protein [Condylostylus longicornis]|uniref:RCC1-like G exchanging factor-like protein n=1 Tax=Condylostylus longicornis TaxID=2530218 RepID=UPI00244DF10C|nr:RCC1-like G exchanging factor-like protein [Condylostylus longicornis]
MNKLNTNTLFLPIYFCRKYASRAKRTVLLQNREKFTEHEYRKAPSIQKRIYVWGFSETGALGVNTHEKEAAKRHKAVVHHPTRLNFADRNEVKDIAAGYGFSAFVTKGGKHDVLYGTGLNSDNQIGLQERGQINDPRKLALVIYPTPIHIPNKSNEFKVKCISAGRAHLVFATTDDSFFALGNNSYGQCGREIIRNEKYHESCIVNQINKEQLFNNVEDSIKQLECGQDHTLILTEKGKVLSCGWGSDGQTGRGDFLTTGNIDYVNGDIKGENIIKIASTADCILALNDKGEVFGWGSSEYGQLDDNHNGCQFHTPIKLKLTKGFGKIIDIASGGSFCMILNDEGDVFTWGYGILGFGPHVEQSSIPKQLVPVMFNRNEFNRNCKVESIYCGVFHMAAINSDNDLFMWGKNRFGCLGLGHSKDQFFPFKTTINAKVKKLSCGVDHNLALCIPFI